jgi:hypothetical protein
MLKSIALTPLPRNMTDLTWNREFLNLKQAINIIEIEFKQSRAYTRA